MSRLVAPWSGGVKTWGGVPSDCIGDEGDTAFDRDLCPPFDHQHGEYSRVPQEQPCVREKTYGLARRLEYGPMLVIAG